MPWLTPCPNCFPIASNFFFFFCERSPDRGCRRLQFLFCLDCEHEMLDKTVSFWYLHLRIEVYLSTRRHVRSSHGAEELVGGGNKDHLMILVLVCALI